MGELPDFSFGERIELQHDGEHMGYASVAWWDDTHLGLIVDDEEPRWYVASRSDLTGEGANCLNMADLRPAVLGGP
jgi:hypothetical protein